MKNLFFLLSILLSFSYLPAAAQQYEYSEPVMSTARLNVNKLHFGMYIAPDISWLHPTASKSDDGNYFVRSNGGKLGYMWGLMMDYYFEQNYGFTTGFDINSGGGRVITSFNPAMVNSTGANTVLNTDFDYKLQYLEIPFALKLRSDRVNRQGLRIFGQLGFTLGVNISKKATYTVNYNDETGANRTLQGDDEKLAGSLSATPIMLQLNMGCGLQYPIAPKLHFYTGIFFNNGFLPNAVSPKNFELGYKGTFTDGYLRLNSISLRAGLFF